jgi:hypothetical protein
MKRITEKIKHVYHSKWFPRVFYKKPDGGKDSGVTAYFLIEWKILFSIGVLRFKKGTREAYHNHAFNALTWWLKGKVTEEKINGEKKDFEKHFKSFVNRLVLNESFQEWEERVRNKIRPVNSPEFDEIIYLENINNPEVSHFDMLRTQGSNYLWSIENYSDFYDSETAEMVYQKHKDYFEKFNYDFYSYLDFYSPVEKVHVLHGKQSNIFHI